MALKSGESIPSSREIQSVLKATLNSVYCLPEKPYTYATGMFCQARAVMVDML